MNTPLAVAEGWKLEVSGDWNVLGPFPIHAREQHFLSPAFPLNISEPVDLSRKYPSSYADGGLVGWSTATSNDQGNLQISFPEIRWKYLRAFEGWAALQHHAVLHTTLKVKWDGGAGQAVEAPRPNLLVHLKGGSFLTVTPVNSGSQYTPKWYASNIYGLERPIRHVVPLPPSDNGEYQLFVSGDYEIRLFGDPDVQGLDGPTQSVDLEISLEYEDTAYALESALNIVPYFVDGYAFGQAFGVGVRAVSEWITVKKAAVVGSSEALSAIDLELLGDIQLAPGQSRVVPLRITQKSPFKGEQLDLQLIIQTSSLTDFSTISIPLPVKQLERWLPSRRVPILGTYLFAGSVPSYFSALPPLQPNQGKSAPPVVALHGAGVDLVEYTFWAEAMPRNEDNWILMPTGRTSWGLDWHGPSTQDVWESLQGLSSILSSNEQWKEQAFPPDTRVILIGHSNGGQGTWHISSHYPDRVISAVPAAAYMKSQSYIPLTHSRSSHYIDPVLRAILEASLGPDDNDLHVSNLINKPILAVHGGIDENVPVWHSRQVVNALQTLSGVIGVPNQVHLKEDQGQTHWYGSVLNNEEVQDFLSKSFKAFQEAESSPRSTPTPFVLTVFNPTETGSLHGFRIHSLLVPGRLGKLQVERGAEGTLRITPSNVEAFLITEGSSLRNISRVVVGESTLHLSRSASFPVGLKWNGHQWSLDPHLANEPPVPTRIQSILTSPGPLTLVYSSVEDLSIVTRLANDLQVYHRLDSEIIPESEAIHRQRTGSWKPGNIVAFGNTKSKYISLILDERKTSFEIKDGNVLLAGKRLQAQEDRGYLFLHPHPRKMGGAGVVLLGIYTTPASLERLGKLFPLRTGIPSPSWLIVGPSADQLGAAGIEGAGVWDARWKYKEASSWIA